MAPWFEATPIHDWILYEPFAPDKLTTVSPTNRAGFMGLLGGPPLTHLNLIAYALPTVMNFS
jgi:hypothetical protein